MSEEVVSWILIACTIVLALYIFSSFFLERSMVKSKANSPATSLETNQFYYLPTASLDVATKAKVVITKNAAGVITNATVTQIVLTNTVKIVPDTSKVYTLSYQESVFSNDNLVVNVGASGLLEGINLTAEDRIANLIDQIASAPQLMLNGSQTFPSPLAAAAGETITVELREVENSFFVSPGKINDGEESFDWKIKLEGLQAGGVDPDASFKMTFGKTNAATLAGEKAEADGIVSRLLTTLNVTVETTGLPTKVKTAYTIQVPDIKSQVILPIKRTPFVKKTYVMKFSNGLVTEAAIGKPSEVEGFLGIPIKIGKAIATIPAQLLSFKIENVRKETSLLTNQQALLAAQLTGRKNEAAQETELLKAKLESEKGLLKAQKDLTDARKTLITAKQALEAVIKSSIHT